MQITEAQKNQVSSLLASGSSISDIQRLVNEEFEIPMTYMEVRFLIDDLELDVGDPPKPEKTEDKPAADPNASLEPEPDGVSVEIDRIKRPGAALSGSVVFSDGQKAQWYVDNHGRLGLDPDMPGYQPTDEDIQIFQMELQSKIAGPEAR